MVNELRVIRWFENNINQLITYDFGEVVRNATQEFGDISGFIEGLVNDLPELDPNYDITRSELSDLLGFYFRGRRISVQSRILINKYDIIPKMGFNDYLAVIFACPGCINSYPPVMVNNFNRVIRAVNEFATDEFTSFRRRVFLLHKDYMIRKSHPIDFIDYSITSMLDGLISYDL